MYVQIKTNIWHNISIINVVLYEPLARIAYQILSLEMLMRFDIIDNDNE